MLPITVSIVHESIEDFEVAGCINCLIFDGYFIVADTAHVHCKPRLWRSCASGVFLLIQVLRIS